MPLQERALITCKADTVELTMTVLDGHRDEPSAFAQQVAEVLFEHQYQAMTDPAILNPDSLGLASGLESRDPLPAPLKDALISLGFAPVEGETGAAEESSLFARLKRSTRTKLDKWRTPYLRLRDLSARLGAFEEALVAEVPAQGSYAEIAEEASAALIAAARTHLRLLLAPGREHVAQLERLIGQERAQKKGRLVLCPRAVRALASYVGQSFIQEAPDTGWQEDEDSPLWIAAPGGATVRSDPEYRVVGFVTKSSKELLSAYMESSLRQSLTAASRRSTNG